MLSPKERLHKALEGKKVDRVPCICPGGMMNMITSELMDKVNIYLPEAHNDARQMAELAKSVYATQCFENYGVPFCMSVEAQSMGAEVDMGNNIFEPHVIDYAINSVSDYKQIKTNDLNQGRENIILQAINILKDETVDVPIIGNLTGPISMASSVMEPVNFYKELRKKNKEAHEYMNFITEYLISFGRAQIAAGADIIAISDPSGTGEILGPKLFEEFALTYLNKLLDGIKTDGVKTIVHICGSMQPVYQQVSKVRSHALSFDSIVSLTDAKKHLPDKILMGNVSTYTLEFGKPEAIKTLTKNCIKNGSSIISPACGLGMKSSLENVQAILKAVKESTNEQ